VLEDAPPSEGIPSPIRPRGGRLALIGFALVVVTSLAAVAGVLGVAFALFVTYRPLDPRGEAAAYGFLGLLIVVAAAIQQRHPPILSEATYWPWVAVVGGALAILGGVLKMGGVIEARRANS
jgi:hypothetical protein